MARPKCVRTGKVTYGSHTDALLALVEVVFDLGGHKPDRTFCPKRTYQCEFCRLWHLTSKEYDPNHLSKYRKGVSSEQQVSQIPNTDRRQSNGTS